MSKSHWFKFYCPKCHHCFRQKKLKNTPDVVFAADQLPFEVHVHCPRCEEYIPFKERIK